MLPRCSRFGGALLDTSRRSPLSASLTDQIQLCASWLMTQTRGRSDGSATGDLAHDIASRLPQVLNSRSTPADAGFAQTLTQTQLPRGSRRTGVIAVKAGMTQEWDAWGQRVPLTVLWIDDCEVVQTKTAAKEGYCSVQLGIGAKRDKQLHPRQLGHFEAADVPNKRKLAEFRVSPDALLPPKTRVSAAHFVAGQYVDVQGTSIGKGFQGVMKKWGFGGQPASHGNSLSHRAAGSIGGCQDPGKVWPGKKMAGRMGNVTRSVMSAFVYKVDPERNLIYVRGQVPGHKGNFVLVKDAAKKLYRDQPQRPFPTFLGERASGVTYAPKPAHNPFEARER